MPSQPPVKNWMGHAEERADMAEQDWGCRSDRSIVSIQVSAMKWGLLPVSHNALLVGDMAYYDFNGEMEQEADRINLQKCLGPTCKVSTAPLGKVPLEALPKTPAVKMAHAYGDSSEAADQRSVMLLGDFSACPESSHVCLQGWHHAVSSPFSSLAIGRNCFMCY